MRNAALYLRNLDGKALRIGFWVVCLATFLPSNGLAEPLASQGLSGSVPILPKWGYALIGGALLLLGSRIERRLRGPPRKR